ncbi:hypothetical protein HPG69_012277 [Diceros bicornis minor]|uniref:BEN domain-containing protein 5 n=1 Tax=Diceros bicornis minor TaxID=77932 RepID=A0A7J7F5F8_DICBM|nr:hypothetical protein HPG69_012277 [Diceros bicornis minor]
MNLVLLIYILEDKSDLENSVMQKKIKIPKLSLSHVEEDEEVKDYGEEDLQLRHIKRPEGRKPSEVAHKSIEAVVARLEKQNGLSLGHSTCPEEVFVEASPGTEDMDSLEDSVVPRALYEELLRNYQQQQEEMRHLQQELERTRRQLVQQAKKLKEYGALVSEMKELRDLNRRLQDVLLLRLGSGECPRRPPTTPQGRDALLCAAPLPGEQEGEAGQASLRLGKGGDLAQHLPNVEPLPPTGKPRGTDEGSSLCYPEHSEGH